MLQTTLNIFAVVLVFGALIFFHEMGHFLVARFFSIGVKTFSLGFGPRLLAFTRGKTTYQLAAIPLGGFVSIVGETRDAELPEPFTKEESFALRPAWQRLLVIAAGSVFNLLLAWIIIWGVLFANGKVEIDPVVGMVGENSPAAHAGLRPGDRINAINGAPITDFSQILYRLYQNGEKPAAVTIAREGQEPFTLSLTPVKVREDLGSGNKVDRWVIGISSTQPRIVELSFFEAALQGADSAAKMVSATWQGLSGLMTKKVGLDSMSGPVGITQTIYKQAEHGLVQLLMFTALISVNLGILNLLPIPVLDGGHLFFISLEMIFRKPVPPRIQERAMMIGIALLLSLMIFATFNDVSRIATSPGNSTGSRAANGTDINRLFSNGTKSIPATRENNGTQAVSPAGNGSSPGNAAPLPAANGTANP